MITDTLQHLSRYRGIHPNLDEAIDWLQGHDLASLPNGRTTVNGNEVFINVMDADLRHAEGASFECHHHYADLQIDIAGEEYWAWAASGKPEKPFDAQIDIGFVTGPEQCSGILGDGRFALFLPGEPHKPSCINGSCVRARKAVVKIRMA